MKTQRILAVLVLLALLAMVPEVTVGGPLDLPMVDGRFYGNNDVAHYDHHVGALGSRGTLHWTLSGDTLFLAVEVSPINPYVNDNVFGRTKESPGDTDVAYVQSAGWGGTGSQHRGDALINSDAVTINLTCGPNSWTWKQDYAYDVDSDPFNGNWQSDHLGGDGSGSGPVLESASTFQWNMNHTTWDVTLDDARSGSSEWRSPDGQNELDPLYLDGSVLNDSWGEGQSWYWSDGTNLQNGWEWVMVYETKVDVQACNDAGAAISVEVLSAHNSPPKEGDPDVPIPVADFGDAPDPAYPTLLASMGAHHVLPLMGGGPMLGPTVDAEANGQPEAHAQGDDYNDEGDDEDGVCFCAAPVLWGDPSVEVDVEVSVEDCFVNAWIDFGGDGSWAEGDDQILTDEFLTAGSTHYPDFSVPSAPAGDPWLITYARFRCSTADRATGGYTHIGRAPDGEVEDYELVVNDVPVEFGDLPDTYGTTLGHSGAYHFVANDFFLGLSADGEGNGNPSPNADGDDTCPPGSDDEDGVIMPAKVEPGMTNYMQVHLTDGSLRGGVLDAWMDFDANGWDEGDRILTGYALVPGSNTVPFDVPWYGPAGDPGGLAPPGTPIYSRFRLTAATGLRSAGIMGPVAIAGVNDPTGPGGIGEVEDYKTEAPTAVTVASFAASQAGAAVLVEWETASEIDNLGFNLYRSAPEAGARIKLNEALIPTRMPPGSPVGAAYEFVDGTMELGVVYDYWLEAVDIHGQAETYGPVSAGLLTLMIDPGLWSLGTDVQEGGE